MKPEVQEEVKHIVSQIFRQESGKLVSVLTRIFGAGNLDLAEDVVQDAMIEALDRWARNGIPANPSAWIFRVAKNKALNIINHEKYKGKYASDVAHFLKSDWTAEPALNLIFSDHEILDDQLRMMFTCCHPSISPDSQVALALKTLCGFSIPEIARAFLTTEDNINKRLVRARQKIREDNVPFEVPAGNQLEQRLDAVLETIYLLFNEGYSATAGSDPIRYELCAEAMHLADIITQHAAIQNKSGVYALLALMQLSAARFKSRTDGLGNLLTMAEQDRSLWNTQLIREGIANLGRSTGDDQVWIYQVMATIAAYHCTAPDFESTDWQSILMLYDNLVKMDSSPVVLLNRAVALSKVEGPENALIELEKIKNEPALKSYPLLYSTAAEFYIETGQFVNAAIALQAAIQLTSLQAEKDLLQKRLAMCRERIGN